MKELSTIAFSAMQLWGKILKKNSFTNSSFPKMLPHRKVGGMTDNSINIFLIIFCTCLRQVLNMISSAGAASLQKVITLVKMKKNVVISLKSNDSIW